jgi:hypothetical protein
MPGTSRPPKSGGIANKASSSVSVLTNAVPRKVGPRTALVMAPQPARRLHFERGLVVAGGAFG